MWVHAVRSSNSLPDGVTKVDDLRYTGTRWTNGWQVIVTSTAAESADHALGEQGMADVLALAVPV